MKQLLIVEDDALLNKTLCYNLTADGFAITSALNARTAREQMQTHRFDLVLLDVGLPDGDGFTLCTQLKDLHPDTPVIFLTANDGELDQLRGYEVGAIDYITKPFSILALQKKIHAMFHLLDAHKPIKDIFDDGKLLLDFSEQTAALCDKALTLSAMEFKVLNLFRKNQRQVLTRTQLLERLWDVDEKFVDEHTLTTTSICLFSTIGLLLTLLGVTAAVYVTTQREPTLWLGLGLTGLALLWLLTLMLLLRRRLSDFTDDLCGLLDGMMSGKAEKAPDNETLFARLHTRLRRLYEVMEQNEARVENERQELQSLVSDISHQVKTPVSNLKMLTDTLLTKPVTKEERQGFLTGMRSQLDKLDFLFGAMVKSSRLETGLIRLERVQSRIYDTLAQALSGIVYGAEQKQIAVTVDCPEALQICHDSKWTAEALFNILDNAVKYTPAGGSIAVTAEEWELHLKISITDTGKGISEEHHAAVFRRFYREEDVHSTAGVGIGLHLVREIITRQGGYIKLTSSVGQGATFSVFLPKR